MAKGPSQLTDVRQGQEQEFKVMRQCASNRRRELAQSYLLLQLLQLLFLWRGRTGLLRHAWLPCAFCCCCCCYCWGGRGGAGPGAHR